MQRQRIETKREHVGVSLRGRSRDTELRGLRSRNKIQPISILLEVEALEGNATGYSG